MPPAGVKADPASLSRWLIRNGLSFKKSLPASEGERSDVRPARAAWTAERQPKMQTEPHRLVFIDENGNQHKDDPAVRVNERRDWTDMKDAFELAWELRNKNCILHLSSAFFLRISGRRLESLRHYRASNRNGTQNGPRFESDRADRA